MKILEKVRYDAVKSFMILNTNMHGASKINEILCAYVSNITNLELQ